MSESSTDQLVAALHASQARLTAALDGLTEEQAATQSYDDDWSVAQVASHLGSGGELFTGFLEAGITGAAVPGVEEMQPVWDAWNARDPLSQTRDSVTVNDAFLARLDAVTEAERAAWSLDLFGSTRDLDDFLRMRLSEHAVHTWDIVVSFDPTATLAEDASAHVIENLGHDRGLDRAEARRAGLGRGPHHRPRTGLPPRPRARAASRSRRRPTTPTRRRCCRSRPRRSSGWSTAGSTPTTPRPRSTPAASTSTCCAGRSRASDGYSNRSAYGRVCGSENQFECRCVGGGAGSASSHSTGGSRIQWSTAPLSRLRAQPPM